MNQQELAARMARVAVALKRTHNPFRVDVRPFGDGWAAFIDGDFDTKWLESSGRGATEAQACDLAWFGVKVALSEARQQREKRHADLVAEMPAAIARAAHDVALYTAALAVET
jgi:hypothetical protein